MLHYRGFFTAQLQVRSLMVIIVQYSHLHTTPRPARSPWLSHLTGDFLSTLVLCSEADAPAIRLRAYYYIYIRTP